MCTKRIDICHHFMRDMVEYKDIIINYTKREENPVDIMKKNFLEAYFLKHMKIFTEGELWELVETGMENVNITRVTDDVIKCDKYEYFSHTLAQVVDG